MINKINDIINGQLYNQHNDKVAEDSIGFKVSSRWHLEIQKKPSNNIVKKTVHRYM